MARFHSQPGRFRVRSVAANDVAACAALEAACFPPAEAASLERIAQRAAQYSDGFVVLELDGRLIGMVNAAAADHPNLADEELKALVGHDPDGAELVVFSVAIHPDFQGRGWARPLMEGFLARARALGKSAVLLLCKQHLVPFYARFGFVDAGRSASTHGGAVWHEMRAEL